MSVRASMRPTPMCRPRRISRSTRSPTCTASAPPTSARGGPMWDDADLYDLEPAEYTADIPYWQELIDQYRPRRVLELACGTGRLLLPVARWGGVQTPGF